jgi:hypothetical protein
VKTPDDIKKGLECCNKGNCKECPYRESEHIDCQEQMLKDARAYIEQLEANQHRWRSPKSEPPDVDMFFAVTKFDPEIRIYKKNLIDQHYTAEWLNIRNDILWWMPVPDVPKED